MKWQRHLATSIDDDASMLNYFIEHSSGISLKLEDSDLTANAVLMKHLIGTLIRYQNGGQFEPYLAETVEKLDDGRVWRFKLKSNLKCEDGEPITADGFRASFLRLAKRYAQNGNLPILSGLDGWSDYMSGGDLVGLSVLDQNQIQFRFLKPAGAGFLEYLSMPYFGYVCASAFSKGEQVDPSYISSSGPYQLKQPATPHLAKLRLRDDWPLTSIDAPKFVNYIGQITGASWQARNSIIQTSRAWDLEEPKDYRRVWGPPDIIRSIVMDDGPSHFLSKKSNRETLRNQLYLAKTSTPFRSKTAKLAKSFYPGFDFERVTKLEGSAKPDRKLLVFVPTTDTDESKYMLNITLGALRALNWPYEILKPGAETGLKSTDVRSRSRFDIRITNVVGGSVMEPWVAEMMFCSDLGVSFPDPSGAVCKFVHACMKNESNFDPKQGSRQLSELVEIDASIVPIYHGHTTWYFAQNLDLSRIQGDMILPSFEDIQIRDESHD
jgi:Bacterial extracellular solute-binding proteins, family 5 Middle